MDVVFEPIPTLGIVKAHLIINCILAFITIVVLGLRLYARHRAGAKLWWDDYLILAAMVGCPKGGTLESSHSEYCLANTENSPKELECWSFRECVSSWQCLP